MSGFANPVVGGQGTLIRDMIRSPNFVSNTSGWQISKDGSAQFNNLTIRGTFNGTNFVLNSSGLFFYSGAPALGNLIQSVTNGTGTDGQGNAYLTGTTVYEQVGGTFIATSLQAGTIAWFTASAAGGPYTQQTDVGFSFNNVTGGTLLLQAADKVKLGQLVTAVVDDLNDLVTLGRDSALIADGANNRVAIALGALTNVGNNTLGLPSGGGPFIPGESFHDISNGVSGVVARVKLLPWNAVWLDVEATEGATGTFNLASLPNSSYWPVRDRHFPLGTTAGTNGRVFVSSSGAATQIIVGGTGAWSGGLSVTYPTN